MYGFGSQNISLFNPIHEFSRTTLFIDDLINFSIKEVSFCLLNYFFELFPVFKLFRLFIYIQISIAIVVPPSFGILCNVYNLGVFVPYSVNIVGE